MSVPKSEAEGEEDEEGKSSMKMGRRKTREESRETRWKPQNTESRGDAWKEDERRKP